MASNRHEMIVNMFSLKVAVIRSTFHDDEEPETKPAGERIPLR